jgi:hypothetical protein
VRRSRLILPALLAAVIGISSVFLGGVAAGAPAPQASTVFTQLTLQNGWTNAPFSTRNAAVRVINGIVHLRGAIATTGTNAQAFTLPAAFRPTTNVYVPVDLCNATDGRLFIQPNGAVFVNAEDSFSNAQCFTSLEGASFARTSTSFTALILLNGWTNAPFATSNAAARTIDGIVHLKGAIATSGINMQPFMLPAAFRPATDVYVPIDQCNAANGRLLIQSTGAVFVQTETSTADSQCFTSLDGVSFARNATSFTPLTLKNGWTNAPFATSNAAARTISGIVHLKGAIATSGTVMQAFTLPAAFRPAKNVYVQVDLCNATNGRLFIQPNGTVTVMAEGGTISNAQCFTSLDGASFAL